ncbi:MAG: hypothetical protein ABIN57_08335 [Chitinophagaceae bacterium]
MKSIRMNRGIVVYEQYFGALQQDKVHAVMSLTKSFTGIMAAILVEEILFDVAYQRFAYLMPHFILLLNGASPLLLIRGQKLAK